MKRVLLAAHDLTSRELADDTDGEVRIAVAERTNDENLLAKLAEDEDWRVRDIVAERTDDENTLAKLADDEEPYVRQTAIGRSNYASKSAKSRKRVINANAQSSLASSDVHESINELKMTSVTDTESYLAILTKCVNNFKADYSKVPKGMAGLDYSYNDPKHYVYLNYKPLADECKQTLTELSISGYGRYDVLKLKIQKLCQFVDYNFPYGWKYC